MSSDVFRCLRSQRHSVNDIKLTKAANLHLFKDAAKSELMMYLLTKWHMFTLISLINQPTISLVTASFLGPSDLSWVNLFLCIWRQLLLVAIIVAAPGKYGFYRNKTWQSQRVCTSELCHCKPLAGDNLRVKVIFRGSVLLRPVFARLSSTQNRCWGVERQFLFVFSLKLEMKLTGCLYDIWIVLSQSLKVKTVSEDDKLTYLFITPQFDC